ncbi:MAG: hypothetical protein K2Q28_16385 [Hyphomicrobium sp.]|nr:hypothetical protein [Hyphomicrobium sp.]
MLQSRISGFTASGFSAELEAGEAENNQRLLEHLISEAHAVAVEVAVVTTAANALNDWRTPIAPGDMARFTPQTSTLRALLLVLDNNHMIDDRASGELLTFIAEGMRRVQRSTHILTTAKHFQQIVRAWCMRVCCASAGALSLTSPSVTSSISKAHGRLRFRNSSRKTLESFRRS